MTYTSQQIIDAYCICAKYKVTDGTKDQFISAQKITIQAKLNAQRAALQAQLDAIPTTAAKYMQDMAVKKLIADGAITIASDNSVIVI